MEKRDYSEYERRRAEDHEQAYRVVGSCIGVALGQCHRRQCFRQGSCRGPMLPSRHQQGSVRAQKLIGLTGTACAALPSCIANIDDTFVGDMRKMAEQAIETWSDAVVAAKGDPGRGAYIVQRVSVRLARALRHSWRHGRPL
jgi:hypothetical protein